LNNCHGEHREKKDKLTEIIIDDLFQLAES